MGAGLIDVFKISSLRSAMSAPSSGVPHGGDARAVGGNDILTTEPKVFAFSLYSEDSDYTVFLNAYLQFVFNTGKLTLGTSQVSDFPRTQHPPL